MKMGEALARDSDISANSAWSVGTLRDYFLGLIGANDRRYAGEISHLHDLVLRADLRYSERAEAQQRAVDTAFAAQQRAVDTAFTAQQTGLNAALLAQKEAVATALVAAEKAVNAALMSSAQAVQKAEASSERRFEGVNEFRATLADQQRTLIPRAEVEVLIKSLNDKVDVLSMAYRDHNSVSVGSQAGWAKAVAVVGLIALLIAIASFFVKH